MSVKSAGPASSRTSAANDYLRECQRRFRAAAEAAGIRSEKLSLADRTLSLEFAGEALREALLPAFSHLPAGGGGADFTISAWDLESAGMEAPPLPWAADDVRELGQVRGFNDDRMRTVLDRTSGAVTVVDLAESRAFFQLPALSRLPAYTRAAPFRDALHWLVEERGLGLVHAGAVGVGDAGVLLAGRSGNGKTTMALAAILAGLDFTADDYVIVTMHPEPVAHSVHVTAKVHDATIRLLPDLDRAVVHRADPPEKSIVDPRLLSAGRIRPAMKVGAIVLPRVEPGPATLTPVSGGQGLLALAPSTLLQLPTREGAFEGMGLLARTVPTYTLSVGDDPRASAELLRNLVSDGG
jgi:hypothetical protein